VRPRVPSLALQKREKGGGEGEKGNRYSFFLVAVRKVEVQNQSTFS
jgi:hypothetical protein